MKVPELLKSLSKEGWFVVAQKGESQTLNHGQKPGKMTIACDPYADVPPGVLGSLLKQAGQKVAEGTAMKRTFTIIVESGPTSYGAFVKDLPGCVAVALTVAEVRKLIGEAIVFHLRGLEQDGQPVPRPKPR